MSVTDIPHVRRYPFKVNRDERGFLSEVYHVGQMPEVPAMQLNVMGSKAKSLRGCHIHTKHWDYFVMAKGEARILVKDVRKKSATFGGVRAYQIGEKDGLTMPPGVVHAAYFAEDAVLLTVESLYYDPTEEFKVSPQDPKLGFQLAHLQVDWDSVILPPTDGLGYDELMEKIEPHQQEFPV